MRRVLKALVVLLAFALVGTAYLAAVDQSKWGYRVGDYIEYEMATADGDISSRFTVKELGLTQVRVGHHLYNSSMSQDAGDIWLDKNSELYFDAWAITSDQTRLPDETITTPWGALSCQVYTFESQDWTHKAWIHDGVLIKRQDGSSTFMALSGIFGSSGCRAMGIN